jgi:hypothetical protein
MLVNEKVIASGSWQDLGTLVNASQKSTLGSSTPAQTSSLRVVTHRRKTARRSSAFGVDSAREIRFEGPTIR